MTPIGRRRLPRAERRAQLIAAAATAFLDGGYDGTSMEAVAEVAGVTRLIVYRNFASKEELYRAVLAAVTDRLAAEFNDHSDETGPGSEGGPWVARGVLRVARSQPEAFRLLWRHADHEATFAAEASAFRSVATTYATALIHADVRDPAFRRWAAASLVAHLYDGICVWLDDGDASRDQEFTERMAAGLRSLVAAWS